MDSTLEKSWGDLVEVRYSNTNVVFPTTSCNAKQNRGNEIKKVLYFCATPIEYMPRTPIKMISYKPWSTHS